MGPQTCLFRKEIYMPGDKRYTCMKGQSIIDIIGNCQKRPVNDFNHTVPSSRTVSKFSGTVIKAQNSLISWLFVRYPSFFSWFSRLIIWKENYFNW